MTKFAFLTSLGLPLSLLALAVLLAAGLGTRFEAWHFRTGFLLLRVAFGIGVLGALLSIVSAFTSSGAGRAFGAAGLVLGLCAVWIPLNWSLTAAKVPAIHDITTDTANPPAFEAVLEARKGSPNPAEYGGEEVAGKQRAAYPDVVPLELALQPDAAFERALGAATGSGWLIVAADRQRGRIEATDTTFWFGFKDDVVIRITPSGVGSRIDVRSVSRVGRSDVGTNAKRILNYLAKMNAVG